MIYFLQNTIWVCLLFQNNFSFIIYCWSGFVFFFCLYFLLLLFSFQIVMVVQHLCSDFGFFFWFGFQVVCKFLTLGKCSHNFFFLSDWDWDLFVCSNQHLSKFAFYIFLPFACYLTLPDLIQSILNWKTNFLQSSIYVDVF